MNRLRVYAVTASVLFLLAASTRSVLADRAASQKTLMEAIPAEAWGFLAIPSLENLDAKVAMLNKQLGVNIPPIVQAGAGQLGLTEELNGKGGLAIVSLDYKKYAQTGPQNSLVLLMPANDPDAMLKKLAASAPGADDGAAEGGDDKAAKPDAGADDGVVRAGMMGMPVFATKRGSFVIIGTSKDACVSVAKSKKSLAETIEKQRLDTFAKADIIISFAAASWMKQFDDQIKNITSMMAMAAGPQGAQASQGINELITMLGQVESADVCLLIEQSGVGLVGLGTPQAGSDLAKTLKTRKPQTESFLNRLPLDKFAFTFGMLAQDPAKVDEKQAQEAIQQVLSSFGLQEKIDEAKLKEYVAEAVATGKLFGQTSMSINVLPDGADGIVNASLVMECKDTDDAMKRFGKMVTLAKGLSEDEEFKKFAAAVEYKAASETLAGAKVDTVVVDLKKLSDQVEPEDAEAINKIVGKDGLTLRFAPAGKSHIILSLGGGKACCEKLIKTAETKSGGLNDDAGIIRVGKHLPSSKTGEFYVAVDSIVDAIQRVMTAVGEEEGVPFKLGKVNAPLAASTTVDSNSSRLDIFVPMELITSVKDSVLAAQAGEEEEEEEGDAPASGAKEKPADKKPADSDDDE